MPGRGAGVPGGGPGGVRPAGWSVPLPRTRLRLGASLVVALTAAVAWVGWALGAELADEGAGPGRPGAADVAAAIVVVTAVVASVVLHEGAHAAAARALGYRVDWVVVGLVDGKTSFSGRSDRPLDRAAIAMAGPAASAAVVLPLLAVWGTGTLGSGSVVSPILWFNVATFGLNLLPVVGSDGWCVIAALVEDRRHRRPNRSRHRGGPAAHYEHDA